MFQRPSTRGRPGPPPRLTVCETVASGCRPPRSMLAMRVPPMKYSKFVVAWRAVDNHVKVTVLLDEGGRQPLVGASNLSDPVFPPPPLLTALRPPAPLGS